MEKYIITFETGEHFITNEITENDENSVCDGYITIIRCSDSKQLDRNLNWIEIRQWKSS